MGSLQDQLLKAGLVKEKTKKAPKKHKKNTGRKKAAASGEISLEQAFRLRAKEEKEQKELSKREKLRLEAKRREQNEQLQALLSEAALNDKKAENERYFEHAGKIRKLYVTDSQQDGLEKGEIGIVFLKGRYYLVKIEHARQAGEIRPESVVSLQDQENKDE